MTSLESMAYEESPEIVILLCRFSWRNSIFAKLTQDIVSGQSHGLNMVMIAEFITLAQGAVLVQ